MRGKACSTEFMRKFAALVDKGCSSQELEDLYCFTRQQVNRLEAALKLTRKMNDIVHPQHLQPSHYVELTTLPEGKQLEVAQQAEEQQWTIKELRKEVCNLKQENINIPPPEGQYHAIVIDPPWPVEKIEREVRPNQVEMDYPTMTLEAITEKLGAYLPPLIPLDGSHIYLWTTHKFLPSALQLFQVLGIRYQCLLTWVKNVGMTPFSWMYSTEHCLFGRVGNLSLLKNGERLDFQASVTRHSEKPDIFYQLVERVSPNPWLDMYGRKERPGWTVWGNEVKNG